MDFRCIWCDSKARSWQKSVYANIWPFSVMLSELGRYEPRTQRVITLLLSLQLRPGHVPADAPLSSPLVARRRHFTAGLPIVSTIT